MNLDNLLHELLAKCPEEDLVMRTGITRAMQIAERKGRKKTKPRNTHLDNVTFPEDKMEVSANELKEIKMKDVEKRLGSMSSKTQSFFKETFDFNSMEEEYSIKMILESVRDLEFDIFDLENKSDGNELFILLQHLMLKEKYAGEFQMRPNKLRNYAYAIQSSYNDITYHNKTHASDVAQTSYYFMFTCDFKTKAKMTTLEQMSMILAGFIHDTDHRGYNNMFYVNTNAPLAIRYNDIAVLENYHAAMGFKIMLGNEKCNIFENMTKEQFKDARSFVLKCVLATDMARHFGDMGKFGGLVGNDDFDPAGNHKLLATEFLFHMADISNPTKPWPLCKKWTDLLFIEFFQQGDKERELGLSISFLMDRTTTNVAKAQDGFIKNLIRPAFVHLEKLLPALSLNIKYMDENLEKWATKVVQYSVNTHSHLETVKSKKNINIEENKSSESEESELKGATPRDELLESGKKSLSVRGLQK